MFYCYCWNILVFTHHVYSKSNIIDCYVRKISNFSIVSLSMFGYYKSQTNKLVQLVPYIFLLDHYLKMTWFMVIMSIFLLFQGMCFDPRRGLQINYFWCHRKASLYTNHFLPDLKILLIATKQLCSVLITLHISAIISRDQHVNDD